MNKTVWRVLIGLLVAGASEMVPVLGLYLAAPFLLVFPAMLGGVHGNHPQLYMGVVLVSNFLGVFGIVYWLVGKAQQTFSK